MSTLVSELERLAGELEKDESSLKDVSLEMLAEKIAKELRVKESDRIAAVAANLRRMGGQIEERPDGMRIPGGQKLHGAEVDSFGDHRIAMAFAVGALRAEGETKILGADAAGVSYPRFFADLASIVSF